jgi:glucose-1-phosphate adenylyltransferase
MAQERILALVLAGGEGGRLDLLTDRRAKPAMPFAGVYRLIDFALSNCAHSGIADVWVLAQYQPHALTEHLANGRPWDLDRTRGGLRVMQPYLGRDESGWYQGNADAIYRNIAAIRAHGPDLILVLSADHVYTLDYREVVARHRERGAAVTLVTTRVPRERAGQHGVVETDDDGRVVAFAYKPDDPASDIVAAEVFVYDAATLLDTIEALAAGDEGEGSLRDFGHELLPRLVEAGHAYEYRLPGYWRDVGTVDSYWSAHMDLVDGAAMVDLDRSDWPILTLAPQRSPACVEATARIDRGLIAPGCTIRGTVVRSVLAPGVVVEAGATVRDAVILHDTHVAAGATVERAVVDMRARIGVGAIVGSATGGEDATEGIALIGLGACVADGATVRAGGRVPPADEG